MIDLQPLWLSFQVATLGTLVALVIAVALAGLMVMRPFPGRDLLDVVLTAPMVLPPTVLGYYLLVALGRDSPIGRAYEAVTGDTIVFTRTGAVIAVVVGALPLVLKSTRAAMAEVDPRLVDAARTLGASRLRAFFTVVLPLSRGGIAAGTTLGFARGLGDFGVTLMIAGSFAGLTRTASLAIYDAVQAGRYAQANGLAATMTALAVIALYFANRMGRTQRWR